MTKLKFLVIAAALAATPALAQGSDAVGRGDVIYSTEGSRIGRVTIVRPEAAGVIYNGRVVYIPLTSLTKNDRGASTSLSRDEIKKL